MSSLSRVVGPARLMAAFTLGSRLLGLVRDAACGYFVGVGAASDAFWIAFLIPNLFRRLFGEGALSAAFIPVFSDHHHTGDRVEAHRVANAVLGLLIGILIGLTLLGELGIGGLWLLEWSDPRTRLTLALTAMMLPFMILICTTATLGGVLHVLGHFATPAFTPILLNIFMIAAVMGGGLVANASPGTLVTLLAGAVLAAGTMQLAVHWEVIRRHGYRLRPAFDSRHESVRRIARTMAPMVIGLGALQVNTLADVLIAYAFIDYDGAPTVLYYAHRLYDFPLGVFGIAVVTAMFAELSRLASRNETARFHHTLIKSVQLVMFIGLPASAGLILVREPLVEFLFQRGAFDEEHTRRVARTLMFYATGVWAYGCQHVFVRGLYALKDSRTPMRVAVGSILLNVPLNLILVWPLAEGGLALSTAVCAVVQVVWLGRSLAARTGRFEWPVVRRSVGRTAVATGIMAAAVAAIDNAVGADSHAGLRLAVMVASGVAVFGASARAMRHEQLAELLVRR